MPCRSYEDEPNWTEKRLREQNDKLARIACKAMDLLEELGKEDFLLIEDKEVRDWWTEHKIADAEAAAEIAARKKMIAESVDLVGKTCRHFGCKKGKYEIAGSPFLDMVRCDECSKTRKRYIKSL